MTTSSDELTFFERLVNGCTVAAYAFYEHFFHEPGQEVILHKYFPEAPSLTQLIRNISLVFLNSHLSIETPRPYVPNMIQIGGLHMQAPEELNPELKKFMDDAHEGVLFFSLGGNAKSSDLPIDKLTAIIKTFEKLPVKVLWKYESNNVPKIPSNVKIGKWLPQSDLLAHPNMKVFVTHGGLLSTIEAVYRGIPMVGIPCFSDQELNVANSVNKGYAVMVRLDDLTEQTLTTAIKEVLNNPRYRENVRHRSMLLKDQPLSPLENAIFWVEYLIRHRGAPHLQTGALKLRWYQCYLLDVLALLVGVITVALFIFSKLIKLLIGKSKQPTVKVSKKSKKD